MHVVPNPVIMTPAKFNFSLGRLWTILKRNPRYWGNIGAVFLVVPTMAVVSAYHHIMAPDVILTRADPEPWQHFDHKKYKIYDDFDHAHYEHPRPRF